jgi:hypothetical protein
MADTDTLQDDKTLLFEKQRLAKYFKMCLSSLSHHYTGLDTGRLTVVYFASLGLDIIDMPLVGKERDEVIAYIYSLQVSFLSDQQPVVLCNLTGQGGFLGSSYLGLPYSSTGHDLSTQSICLPSGCHCLENPVMSSYIQGHIAMTYTALLTLHALGDDLSRIHKPSIIAGNKHANSF